VISKSNLDNSSNKPFLLGLPAQGAGEAQTGFTQHGEYATIILCNQGRKRNLFGLRGLVRKIGPK
jgi:hypothetical protein